MPIYFFIAAVIIAILGRINTARKRLPPIQYSCVSEPITAEWEDRTECDEPEEDPTVLLARADIDRYEAIKIVYIDLLDSLEEEAQIIQTELKNTDTTDKRRTMLAHRMATIKGRIATTTTKLYDLDHKIEKAYQIAVA